MRVVDSYYLTAQPGKELMRNGKSLGVAVWLAPGISHNDIENADVVEVRPMILPDTDKMLRHKTTGETSTGCWMQNTTVEDWEEIDITEDEDAK